MVNVCSYRKIEGGLLMSSEKKFQETLFPKHKLNKISNKIIYGQFFTKKNPFNNIVFKSWLNEAFGCSTNKLILEPFVGGEDIIKLLEECNYSFNYCGYDIEPLTKNTIQLDTLNNYPSDYDIAITNPPYLARNSSTRKGQPWIYNGFDDVYKFALNKMLENNQWVAVIIPATFLTSSFSKDRLSDYIILNVAMFDDTEVPVCLALFKPWASADFHIWEFSENNIVNFVGTYYFLKYKLNKILAQKNKLNIKFNDLNGQYGILATDKSFPSIKFTEGYKIPLSKIKKTSRNIVRFSVNADIPIDVLNKKLADFFNQDGEIFLAPFKNLRVDNKYRRRLDFNTIKRIVESC